MLDTEILLIDMILTLILPTLSAVRDTTRSQLYLPANESLFPTERRWDPLTAQL